MKKEFDDASVAILPRSNAVVYMSDISQFRNDQYYQNALFAEQPAYNRWLQFGDVKVEPNGVNNMFPYDFKALLDSVYIGHGIKRTLINLLVSGGIGLYRDVIVDKKIVKEWTLDSEVSDWLDSWDFETKYLPEAATDFIYIENIWTAFLRNRGARLGDKAFIAALQYLPAEEMRLEYPDDKGNRTNVYRADWLFSNIVYSDIVKYPMFDKNNPFKHPYSVMFTRMPTFGSEGYGRPADIGAAQMLQVLALLPRFHRANLTERGFKWIVAISRDYYEHIQKRYQWTDESKEFAEWKVNFQKAIDDFLIAPEADKLQSRFMTEYMIDRYSNQPMDAVKITKLDDDTKELSEVGISMHDTYTAGYASAVSLHPQLANLHLKNHSLSGSNLREAYEMHIRTAVPMMRTLLLHAVNTAIKLNFPQKRLKVGFQDLAFSDYTEKNTQIKSKSDDNVIQ